MMARINSDEKRTALPSVDRLLTSPEGSQLEVRHGRALAVEAARSVLADHRARLANEPATGVPSSIALAAQCAAWIENLIRPSLRPVFNLSGTVLHTNLGRALLPRAAVQAALNVMERPVNLEY